MDEVIRIGPALRERRELLGWTQEHLAERAGISADLVGRLERGTRTGSLPTIVRLARALDCDPGDLTGKASRVEPVGDGGVLAVRDAIYDPTVLLPGEPEDEPAAPAELMAAVEQGYGAYFAGEFGALASMLPNLLRQCRASQDAYGAQAAAPHAHAYDLAAALLVHTGRHDAALHGMERAVLTARDGDDELRPAAFLGTYAWVLMNMGRPGAAEQLAVRAADSIAPRMNTSDSRHLATWGRLMLWAASAAASDTDHADANRLSLVRDYLQAAKAAALRLPGSRSPSGAYGSSRYYWIEFGPTQVLVQDTYIHTSMGKPDRALKAAAQVRAAEMLPIHYGRHLLDVSRCLHLRRRTDEAIETAAQARELSPEWFRHQRFAASLVEDLRRRKTRPPEPLAQMISDLRSS